MDSGLYAACAGLVARTQALDLAAHNLANVNTNGYKAQLPTFQSVLANASVSTSSDPIARAVDDYGVMGESRTNPAQGSLEHTGSDFDLALQGDGWFAIQTGNGRLYTRNGNFHVDREGKLVTAEGNAVLGTQGPITVPPGKLFVSGDGTVSVDGALTGQLRIVQFSPATALTPAGVSSFAAPAEAERTGTAQVMQGSLENSNVSPVSAAVDLVTLQRNADLLQQALTAIHSNFNRIAAQNLPQI